MTTPAVYCTRNNCFAVATNCDWMHLVRFFRRAFHFHFIVSWLFCLTVVLTVIIGSSQEGSPHLYVSVSHRNNNREHEKKSYDNPFYYYFIISYLRYLLSTNVVCKKSQFCNNNTATSCFTTKTPHSMNIPNSSVSLLENKTISCYKGKKKAKST